MVKYLLLSRFLERGNNFALMEKAAKLLEADLMFLAAGKMFLSIKPSYFNTYY
jgi:hypothetical protein